MTAQQPEAHSIGPFTAVYEHHESWWIGYVEELPGANSQGRTIEEVRENLEEAARLIIEVNRELARRDAAGKSVVREALAVTFT